MRNSSLCQTISYLKPRPRFYGRLPQAQTRIFSWVIEAPVKLIGVVENRGRYNYEAEEIDASGLPPDEIFPEIPADLGRREEACEECGYGEFLYVRLE